MAKYPKGHWWQSNRPGRRPDKWIRRVRICTCKRHGKNRWPIRNAVITIPACCSSCPYCGHVPKGKGKAANIRKHIRNKHIISDN
ncbi:unnamed protein product [Penicillium palitans]